jgi:hypothetical protein
LLRDLGPTEVGGFALSAADDLLLVEDVQMVEQDCSPASVHFDDQSVADFFDRQIDAGLQPERFSRIWVHTHPDNSARPSTTDERTFRRVFGQVEWAVMFILARGDQIYARLRFNVGPGGEQMIPVSVDYTRPFAGARWDDWQGEYAANVTEIEPFHGRLSDRAKCATQSAAFHGHEPPLFSREQDFRFVRAEVLGGRARSERYQSADPFFAPERVDSADDEDYLRQGYFYDE